MGRDLLPKSCPGRLTSQERLGHDACDAEL
jgi:hypothetical protein